MFSEAGVTESEKGRYGKTIRPFLSTESSSDYKDPLGWDLTAGQTQEWTQTTIAAAPGFSEAGSEPYAAKPVDTYTLSICGRNVVDVTSTHGTQYYTRVGMIHSYNQDRQEVVTPTVDSQTIEGQNNPLALLRQGGSVSGGEVMDIVEDQELEAPPYDITDGGASVLIAPSDMMQINPGNGGQNADGSPKPLIPVLRQTTMFVPAGLLYLSATEADSDAILLVEVIGEVLCKDMA